MASEKDGQLVKFICDNCSAEYEIQSHSFHSAWEEAKAEGWICFKDDDGNWTHRCPDCRGG